MFCRSVFVLLSFFFWPLWRLSKPHPQIQGVKSGAPEVVQVPLVSLVALLFGLWLRQTEHISGHLWHRYYKVFCVMFCRSVFVLLSFFFWPLCFLAFDLRILSTPLASSTSSCTAINGYYISDILYLLCLRFYFIKFTQINH
jgi:hypothetical protein